MGNSIFYMILALACLVEFTKPTPTGTVLPENKETQKPILNNQNANKTIAQLVQQQTDTIKKIVADQQHHTRLDYPIITKYDAQYTEEAKKEIEELSLEELKIRCQHLSKLLNTNKTENKHTTEYNKNEKIDSLTLPTKLSNHRPLTLQKRPVYVPPKPTFVTKYTTTQKTNGFYITTQPSTTKMSTKPTPPTVTSNNIKYIRLEPVILQKTILNDGRTIYYWHRSLPSAVGYPLQQNNADASGRNTETTTESNQHVDTTQTTTTYNRYDFRNFFPSFYGSGKAETTTEKTTTTSTTTTTSPTTEKTNNELLYTQQLRFVVPVPYENPDRGTLKHPWGFDQYAYYPKELQPSTINVQVPYSPSFHMIKTLAIPNGESDSIDNIDIQ